MNAPGLDIILSLDRSGGSDALRASDFSAGTAWDVLTATASVIASGGIQFMALDKVPISLAFYNPDAPDTPWLFDADYSVVCSLGLASELAEESPAELVRLTLTRDGETSRYTGVLDLDLQAALDAVPEGVAVPLVMDVRVAGGDPAALLTWRILGTLNRPMLGTVASPGAVNAAWANTAGAQMRQRTDGLIEWWDYDLEAWVLPVLKSGVLQFQQGA